VVIQGTKRTDNAAQKILMLFMKCHCILQPTFFNEKINSEHYVGFNLLLFFDQLIYEGKLYRHIMQDSPTAHAVNDSVDAIHKAFGFGGLLWPPCSSDSNNFHSSPMVSILSQINPICTVIDYLFKSC
jgi:hypothetical protein